MNTTRRYAPVTTFALTTALVFAACGGSSGAPTATSGPTAPVAAATQVPGGEGPTTDPGGGAASQEPVAGGATLAPGAGGSIDACSILSATDIMRITAAKLVTAVPAQQLGIFTDGCLYELNDGSTTTTINIGVMETGGRQVFDSQIAPGGTDAFSGLGDAAVNFTAGSVVAVAGDTLVSAQYFGPAGPEPAVATDVVRWILQNLGL
jgi:hypothetical protein